MAIGRLSVKVGGAGSAGPHAEYIAREGRYAGRLEHGEKLEATEHGNMPAWAQSVPQMFWQAADAYERKGGTTYREMEIALPRELSATQRLTLVREFVQEEIGERHAYQWAIHTPKAADGQDQPHAHVMFSERQIGGIERDPAQYFKRYNAKTPERGGARKGYGPRAGQTLSAAERAQDLKALRLRWEVLCNRHLEQAGQEARIDMRSHAERGTGREPEVKQLPSQWRGQGRAQVLELRQARQDVADAAREVKQWVPDAGAEVIQLEAARQARAQEEASQRARQAQIEAKRREEEAAQRAQAARAAEQAAQKAQEEAQEWARCERMSADEVFLELRKVAQVPTVEEAVKRDLAVSRASDQRTWLEAKKTRAREEQAQSMQECKAWRQAHPLRAWAHDKGVLMSEYLEQQAGLQARAVDQQKALEQPVTQARAYEADIRAQKRAEFEKTIPPLRARREKLRALLEVKEQQERRAQMAREQSKASRPGHEAGPDDVQKKTVKRMRGRGR